MSSTINRRDFVAACVVFVSISGVTFGQTEFTIVSPGMFADVEGNGRSQAGRAGRVQFLYPAADFESVPESHRFITGFAWRPDVTNQFSNPVSGAVTFRLATTTRESLTSNFGNNLGTDGAIVYSGDLSWQAENDTSGGLRDFEYRVMFDQPFEYSGGNLVLDFLASRNFSNTTSWFVDVHRSSTGPIIGVGTTNPSAGSASFSGQSIYPAQFTFTPELADVNLDGVVNGMDVDPFVDVLLSGQYDWTADMNQDEVVNGLDVDPFVAAVVGGTQQIPEPSTLILCIIALGVVGAWRRWGG